MNISFAWLKAIAPGLEMSVEEVSEHLANRGAPVEDTEYLGVELEDVVLGAQGEVYLLARLAALDHARSVARKPRDGPGA